MNRPPDGGADSYRTLAGQGEAELKVQRSRFLAVAAPAAAQEAAREAIAAVARRYHDSRHVCHAWRLGEGPEPEEAQSDAGEPSGSAGLPILNAIRSAEVSDCVVIVVRYFGGVKLGTGGLGRAYGAAAQAALAAAPRRTVRLGREFSFSLPYPQLGAIAHLLAGCGGRVLDEDYGSEVGWRVWLPRSRWRAFAAALKDATAGSVRLDED